MPESYDIYDLDAISRHLRRFAAARDWQRYHTPANLATALAVEAGELLELFLWGQAPPSDRLADEAADVAIYLIRLCDVAGIDLARAISDKVGRNESRFPPGSDACNFGRVDE